VFVSLLRSLVAVEVDFEFSHDFLVNRLDKAQYHFLFFGKWGSQH